MKYLQFKFLRFALSRQEMQNLQTNILLKQINKLIDFDNFATFMAKKYFITKIIDITNSRHNQYMKTDTMTYDTALIN